GSGAKILLESALVGALANGQLVQSRLKILEIHTCWASAVLSLTVYSQLPRARTGHQAGTAGQARNQHCQHVSRGHSSTYGWQCRGSQIEAEGSVCSRSGHRYTVRPGRNFFKYVLAVLQVHRRLRVQEYPALRQVG